MEPQRQARPEQRDEDVLRIEPILRGWVTRGGKILHPRLQLVWAWLARDGYPHEFTFSLAELGRYFFADSADSPRQWYATLVDEGFCEHVGSVRGPGGGVRVKLLDPHEVDRLRLRRADPQRTLPGIAEMETVDSLPFVTVEGAEDQVDQPLENNSPAQHPAALGNSPLKDEEFPSAAPGCAGELGECVAPAGPPVALQESLRRHVGQGRADVYLGVARWEFGAATKLFLPSQFMRESFRRLGLDKQIRAAVAECGLGEVQLEIDPDLPKKQFPSAAGSCAGELVRFLPGFPSFLPSIQSSANDFWSEEEGPEPLVVRRARELYAAIGDPTLFRSTAFRAVLLVDEGALAADELDRLARERPCDFNTALGEVARRLRAWKPIGFVKSQLKSTHGVTWRRRWDQARTSRPKPR